MIRHDYILRIIQQAVEALARMVGKRDAGDYRGALADAEAVYDALGVTPEIAAAVSSETLAELLGHPESIRTMAKLSHQEAEVYAASGDPLTAAARYRRAAELLLEARALDPQDEDTDMLQELFRHFPTASLADKYLPRDG